MARAIALRNRLMAAFVLTLAPVSGATAFQSYAIVQDDGSMVVQGRRVHLYGIHIPDTGRTCRTTIRPVRCGNEAALALRFRIRGFVRCETVFRNRDRSVDAVCYVDGQGSVLEPDEDLAAYLLRRGLAVAGPDAPFEYVTMERIARAQKRGIWNDGLERLR